MVSDLANVFEEVLRLEERLRPHMQRYLTLLREESDFTQNVWNYMSYIHVHL